MDIKKISNPWNWFSHDDQKRRLPEPLETYSGESVGIRQLHEDLERAFNNVLRNFGFPAVSASSEVMPPLFLRPQLDIVSGEREYVITVEVPGVDEKDVRLELSTQRALIISGEKRHETNRNSRSLHSVERAYGAFRRVLSLPDDADADALDAYFKNGVLTITCPRIGVSAIAPLKQIDIKKIA